METEQQKVVLLSDPSPFQLPTYVKLCDKTNVLIKKTYS